MKQPDISKDPNESKFGSAGYENRSLSIISDPLSTDMVFVWWFILNLSVKFQLFNKSLNVFNVVPFKVFNLDLPINHLDYGYLKQFIIIHAHPM